MRMSSRDGVDVRGAVTAAARKKSLSRKPGIVAGGDAGSPQPRQRLLQKTRGAPPLMDDDQYKNRVSSIGEREWEGI